MQKEEVMRIHKIEREDAWKSLFGLLTKITTFIISTDKIPIVESKAIIGHLEGILAEASRLKDLVIMYEESFEDE